MPEHTRKNIVVIGGGTGASTVVRGLKDLPVNISAVISMADSGGSTGRLRDEFGFPPVGDVRQILAALADKRGQREIADLFLYRFAKGEGLKGHNLGNLILTALQDRAGGSTAEALELAEKIFRLKGKVYPVTDERVQLKIEYKDGSVVVGEDTLNTSAVSGEEIARVSLTPSVKMHPKAVQALQNADAIVIGPGDLYASVIAALSVEDVKEVFAQVRGKIFYIVNLMTRYNQTHGMDAHDHVKGIEDVIGRSIDSVVMNIGKIDDTALRSYADEKEYPVGQKQDDPRFITGNFASDEEVQQSGADALHRSLLRHDPQKLAQAIMEAV